MIRSYVPGKKQPLENQNFTTLRPFHCSLKSLNQHKDTSVETPQPSLELFCQPGKRTEVSPDIQFVSI